MIHVSVTVGKISGARSTYQESHKGNVLSLSQKAPTINSCQLMKHCELCYPGWFVDWFDLIIYRYYILYINYIQLLWSHQCSHPVMPRRYCFALVLLTSGSYHLPSSSSIMVPGIYFANKISNKLFLVISKSLYDNSNVGNMFQHISFWCAPCLFIV